MPLIPDLNFEDLKTADEHLGKDHALISLAMHGRASSPRYAAIWAPMVPFSDGDKVPVRKRIFELDWSQATIAAHAEEKQYPTLVGITAWEFEQPRSILVYEQFSKQGRGIKVVGFEAASEIAGQFQRSVVTGLDMCVFQLPATHPFESDTAREHYVAVIHPRAEPATMFNVQLLESVKDKLDGLDSFSQHRRNARLVTRAPRDTVPEERHRSPTTSSRPLPGRHAQEVAIGDRRRVSMRHSNRGPHQVLADSRPHR